MAGLAAVLIAIAVGAALFAFLYRPQASFGRPRGVFAEGSTTLPGFVERSVHNITGWRFVHNTRFRSAKMTHMLRQTGNPWQLTTIQFYGLMTASALAGGAAGAVLGLFAYGAFFLGALGTPLVGFSVSVLVGAAAGAGMGWFLPYTVLQQRFIRHQQGFVASLGDLEDLFATAAASGQTLEQSIRTAYTYLPDGPARTEMGRIIDDLNIAVPLPEAVESMMSRVPDRHARVFGQLLIDLYVNGSSPAEALRREAAEMRLEQTRLIKERANKVQGLIVILVMILIIPAAIAAFVPGFGPTIAEAFSGFSGAAGGGL